MAENNTLKRCKFNVMFGVLSVYASLKNIKFICTSYTRTAAEQNALFKGGLSQCDGYKKTSYHQKDRARDIVIIDTKGNPVNNFGYHPDYTVLGMFWESLGGVWGGKWPNFKDIFHFQC